MYPDIFQLHDYIIAKNIFSCLNVKKKDEYMISKISAYPNFTSKVYVSNYYDMMSTQEDLVNSKDFLKELEILDKNGHDDIVTFAPDTDPICSSLYITVSERRGGVFKTISGYVDYSSDVPKRYKELKSKLDKNICTLEQKGQLVKYLI